MRDNDIDLSAQRAWLLERLPQGASVLSTAADFAPEDILVVVAPLNDVVERGVHGGVWSPDIRYTASADIPARVAALWNALVPGGVLCLSFEVGPGDRVVNGRVVTDATQGRVVDWMAALPALGPIEMWEVEHATSVGTQLWLHVRAVRQPKLVTGGKGNPFLPQLRTAIRDAVEIDLAVAFIKTTGLRLLLPELEEALVTAKVTRLRVVTSDYLDLTDPEALRLLALLQQKGAVVRVYEAGASSFHMKAYLFAHFRPDAEAEQKLHGTAFIGSSNISRQALTDGLEWNYRVEYPADDGFLEARSRFEDLFANPKTVPLTDEWIDRYQARRRIATFVSEAGANETEAPPTPSSVQQLALQALHETRRQGFRRGLVVLATGLGKTWLAAFDAEQFKAKRVLFVAHREEILDQAAATFVRIRPQAKVGFYIGQQRDMQVDVLCASVQTLGKDAHLQKFAGDHFDYIVVDEFHHAAAPTYQRLLQHFTPKFLLGLTATPDRTDQSDILSLCDDNLVFTRTLFEGVTEKLLVPFHYFGIDDDTVDYREIPWRNGRFDPTELSNKLATVERARHALKTWLDHRQRRTLAFCVSTRHADFMAEHFRRAGFRSAAVYGGSTVGRSDALDQLRSGDLDVVFSVDLFNEGVDLPLIDTVMMLRPTESKILFLQQLGRGLRRAPGKEKLVVLDFIGNHTSFLHKPQALFGLGASYRELAAFARDIAAHDVQLPDGCKVNYDLSLLDFLSSLDTSTSADEYEALRAVFGRRPTLSEFHRSGASVTDMRRQHGSWLRFVDERGDFDDPARSAATTFTTFLGEVETMPLSSCEPLVFLKAFDELDGWMSPPAERDLARGIWEVLARRPRLQADIPRALRAPDDGASAAWLAHCSGVVFPFWTAPRRPFRIASGRVSFVGGDASDALIDLTEELIDYRLASYEARRATIDVATPMPARTATVSLPVVRHEPDDAAPHTIELRDDTGSLSADKHLVFAFSDRPRRVFLVERASASDIIDGVDIGGRVIRELDALTLDVGGRFMREDIPPLFGETFNTGKWNSGHMGVGSDRVVLLVSLNKQGKSEDHRYVDRWSDDGRRFHWQSQRKTTPPDKKGREIVKQTELGTTIHLFVRDERKIQGKGAPFTYAGRVAYVAHTGSAPMNVTFELID